MKIIIKSVAAMLVYSMPLFSQQSYFSNKFLSVANNPSTEGLYFDVSDAGYNSDQAEIGATFYKNKLIILSNKKRGMSNIVRNPHTNQYYKGVFCADIKEDESLSYPLVFSKIFNAEGDQGGVAFTPDQNTVYFTRTKKGRQNSYSIYKANLDLNSKYYWANINELEFNNDSYSVETPFIGSEANKIYFSSNMPGGFGGFDIYEATLNEKGEIVNAKNLGAEINSDKDEKYPFVSENGKHFYFSSNGLGGFGGYDVYRTSVINGEYANRINLGNKLNTTNDDVSFMLHTETSGYVSSNDRNNPDNFNVYKFRLLDAPQQHQIVVTDAETQRPVAQASVVIKDEFGTEIVKSVTDAKGFVKADLEMLTNYTVIVAGKGLETVENTFAVTNNNNGTNTHLKSLSIAKAKPIEIKNNTIVIENIFFDFDKASIKQESIITLNRLVEFLKEKSNIKVSINAHTDDKGTDQYNQNLSERRGGAVLEYLTAHGITKERMTYAGHGESLPKVNCAPNCNKSEDQVNRRVEFIVE